MDLFLPRGIVCPNSTLDEVYARPPDEKRPCACPHCSPATFITKSRAAAGMRSRRLRPMRIPPVAPPSGMFTWYNVTS